MYLLQKLLNIHTLGIKRLMSNIIITNDAVTPTVIPHK